MLEILESTSDAPEIIFIILYAIMGGIFVSSVFDIFFKRFLIRNKKYEQLSEYYSSKIRKIIEIIFTISASLSGIVLIFFEISSNLKINNYNFIENFVSFERETLVIFISLILIIVSISITVILNPSRMTIVAGVAIGFIGAVLMVELGLYLNSYMNQRLDENALFFIKSLFS